MDKVFSDNKELVPIFCKCNNVYEVKSKKLRILPFKYITKINPGGGEVGESWSRVSDPRMEASHGNRRIPHYGNLFDFFSLATASSNSEFI